MRQTCRRSAAPKYGSCARRQYHGPHYSTVRYTYSAFTVNTSLSFVSIFHFSVFFRFTSIHLLAIADCSGGSKWIRSHRTHASERIALYTLFPILSMHGVHAFASHTPLSTIHPKWEILANIRTTIDNVIKRWLRGAHHGGRIGQCFGQWF